MFICFNSSLNFVEGNHTPSGFVPLDGDRNEQKRQRERERNATMPDEKGSERNKKPRQDASAHSTGIVVLLSVILIAIHVIANNNYYV
jgi:hypothetical protein